MQLDVTNETTICPNGTLDIFTRNNGSDLIVYARFAPPINEMVEKVSYPLWCSIGLPGSILSIYIWSRREMRKTGSVAAAVYQTALGCVDLAFFVVQLMWYLHVSWKRRTLDHSFTCESFAVANYLIQYASPVLTLVFTVERYVAICFPFRAGARHLRNSFRNAIRVVVGSLIFCGLMSSVQGIFYTITDGHCGLRKVFEQENSSEWIFYTGWVMFTEMFMFGLLPIICLILNILVIRALHKIAKQNKAMERESFSKPNVRARNSTTSSIIFNPDIQIRLQPQNRKQHQSSTLTLLSVSFYLIFAHLSVAVMVLLYNILPVGDICMTDEQISKDPVWRRHFRFFTIRSLIDSFGISHYAAKFLIYLATSAAFRQQCQILICPCRSNSFDLSNQDHSSTQRLAGATNGAATFINNEHPSTLISTCRLGISQTSITNPSRRMSLSSLGSRLFSGERKTSYTPRQRPQAGISRTVLNDIGERVRIQT